MRNAEAIVFDFNGTLFFDYDENKDAWNIISLKYRNREFEEDEYLSMMGKTDSECVKYINKNLSDEEKERISIEKEEIYLDLCKKRGLRLEEDALSFIERAHKDNILTLIASSAPTMNMDWYYNNLFLDKYFSRNEIIAGRPDIPSKPSPQIFLYALSLFNKAPSRSICFEDSPGGLMAANSAHFNKTYAISSPSLDHNVTSKLGTLINWKEALKNYEKVIELC